jgi:hypothetical protein
MPTTERSLDDDIQQNIHHRGFAKKLLRTTSIGMYLYPMRGIGHSIIIHFGVIFLQNEYWLTFSFTDGKDRKLGCARLWV